MGKSRKIVKLFESFTTEEIKKIIKLAWQDKISYKDIEKKYQLGPNETEKFMQHHLGPKEFIRWKKRQQKRFTYKGKKVLLKRLV